MKNYTILFFCLFFCIISFSVKLWLNSNLKNDVQNIKEKNLRDLEFKTNKNFVQFGIENIGISLRDELLKMDIDNTNVKLATGLPFYFFQESKVYVKSQKKTIVIFFRFDWEYNVFKIRGYQTVN